MSYIVRRAAIYQYLNGSRASARAESLCAKLNAHHEFDYITTNRTRPKCDSLAFAVFTAVWYVLVPPANVLIKVCVCVRAMSASANK